VKQKSDVLISDHEARAVWDRAASLQAQATGTATPVAPPPRDAERQALSPSSAYRLDVVRDSAREAGISTEYVDRALAERGLGENSAGLSPARVSRAAPPAALMEVRDVRIRPISRWAGAPSSIEYEVVVEGEVSEDDFDQLAETIRRTMSDVGVIGAMGRSFTWSATDPKRRVHVSVTMRGGRTTVRVAESLRPLMGSVFGGGVGGFGGGFGGPIFGILMGATGGAFEVAFPAAVTVVAIAYGGSRSVYKGIVRSRQAELRGLAMRLAEEAKASIEARSEPRPRPLVPRR
jgi:hypothetical protein